MIHYNDNIHTDIKELSNAVLYALRTKQLTVSHVLGGIINERLVDKAVIIRRELAIETFRLTSQYDLTISNYLDKVGNNNSSKLSVI